MGGGAGAAGGGPGSVSIEPSGLWPRDVSVFSSRSAIVLAQLSTEARALSSDSINQSIGVSALNTITTR
jgi:hypothetical protein